MCGRFELHSHPASIALAFGLAHPPAVGARYNIAPMQAIPIVRRSAAGERELVQMRWGLVPRWARDPSIGARMINARAETAAQRPAFRNAFARHRCLVPADGFYEWRKDASGKQPMHIARADGRPFGMAALYERWRSSRGEVLDSCVILTTPSNGLLRMLHERMPVIVAAEHFERWLDAANTKVDDLFAPCPDDMLRMHPVSSRVNAVRNDDAALIEPLTGGPGESLAAVARAAAAAPTPHAGVITPATSAAPELPLQARLL